MLGFQAVKAAPVHPLGFAAFRVRYPGTAAGTCRFAASLDHHRFPAGADRPACDSADRGRLNRRRESTHRPHPCAGQRNHARRPPKLQPFHSSRTGYSIGCHSPPWLRFRWLTTTRSTSVCIWMDATSSPLTLQIQPKARQFQQAIPLQLANIQRWQVVSFPRCLRPLPKPPGPLSSPRYQSVSQHRQATGRLISFPPLAVPWRRGV